MFSLLISEQYTACKTFYVWWCGISSFSSRRMRFVIFLGWFVQHSKNFLTKMGLLFVISGCFFTGILTRSGSLTPYGHQHTPCSARLRHQLRWCYNKHWSAVFLSNFWLYQKQNHVAFIFRTADAGLLVLDKFSLFSPRNTIHPALAYRSSLMCPGLMKTDSRMLYLGLSAFEPVFPDQCFFVFNEPSIGYANKCLQRNSTNIPAHLTRFYLIIYPHAVCFHSLVRPLESMSRAVQSFQILQELWFWRTNSRKNIVLIFMDEHGCSSQDH